ncbi:MAG: hypothetical protein H0V17_30005 [Deltaproteobacteria bacterium]|nr:hypothetical protein [Deltaproteobacteria bacterium]
MPRDFSEFGIEERTQVDVGVRSRIQRDEGLIPSIAGTRTAKGTTPPNVIPFTKPRAIAAVVAANPHALVIEASATNALKNFDNTVLPPPKAKPQNGDEPTTPFSMASLETSIARRPAPAPKSAAAARVATGWTPPGAVPTAPVPALPIGAQTLYSTPSPRQVPGPVSGHTVVPVPALHGAQSAPRLSLPPLHAPTPTAPPSRMAAQLTAQSSQPVTMAAYAPASAAAPAMAFPVAAYPVTKPVVPHPAPADPAKLAPPAFMPLGPASVTPIVMPAPIAKQAPTLPSPAPIMAASVPVVDATIGDFATMPEPATHNKWAVFDKLGLGKPRELFKTNPQKLIVNAYKLLGFAILTIIVIVLVGYIANSAFFYMSSSWVVPMQVAATDEKVVALQAQLSEQQNTRDRLADELNQAERSIAMQQSFQLEFAKAIKMDLDGRKAALGRVRELANNAASTRRQIKSQNSAYAGSARKRMALEYQAGLIDRNAMLSGGVQLAQLTSSNLTLAERQAEFETRAAELEATTKSLDAILSNVDGDSALSYEVLRIKQEYAASRLDLAKSIEARNTIKSSLGRQDKIVSSLKKSSYLRAVEDGAAVAFVPFSNLSNADKGTDVYACKVGMVFCYHVGEIIDVLPGEVQFKHPQRDKMLRGQMIEMKLDDDDDDAAAGDVLFVGGKPLFI